MAFLQIIMLILCMAMTFISMPSLISTLDTGNAKVWGILTEISCAIYYFIFFTDEGYLPVEMDTTEGIILLISFFAAIILFFIYLRSTTEIKDLSCKLSYKDHVLTVHKKGMKMDRHVRMEEYQEHTTAYKPEGYVYTSATVGGITTGGFTKTGGYEYITNSKKTGTYQLLYYENTTDRHVTGILDYIQLTPELFEQAKGKGFDQYLDENKKQIVLTKVLPSMASSIEREAALRMAQAGNTNMLRSLGNIKHLSKEDCEKIYSWLCNY